MDINKKKLLKEINDAIFYIEKECAEWAFDNSIDDVNAGDIETKTLYHQKEIDDILLTIDYTLTVNHKETKDNGYNNPSTISVKYDITINEAILTPINFSGEDHNITKLIQKGFRKSYDGKE